MQPTNITLIAVSSSNKEAFYSTPNEPCRQSDIKMDESGRLYYQYGKHCEYLPAQFQNKTK